jgi:hypothetical protein
MPRLFADPLNSGFLPRRRFDPRRSGWAFPVQPYELTSGPEGGGLIVWYGVKSRGGWLPSLIVGSEANMPLPNGMSIYYEKRIAANPDVSSVCYVEPISAGHAFGVVKKVPHVNPGSSFEHADSAGDQLYWVARFKRAKKPTDEIKGLSTVPGWARHFGLEAKRLISGPPADLQAETAPWFTRSEYDSAWFEVSGDGDGVGFHFAVVVYIGNHLSWIAGPRVESMHLVAQIEGKPNPRRTWSRRY